MPELRIAWCVCQRLPFARLLTMARVSGWTLEHLIHETGCGAQCGLCRPYLRRMLTTGETMFTELIDEDDG